MRPGVRTSEFWGTLIGVVVSGLVALGVVDPDQGASPWDQIAGIAGAVAVILGYTRERTRLKVERGK